MKTCISFLIILISSNVWANNLFCNANFSDKGPLQNTTSQMNNTAEGRHVVTYEILRGDCEEGYAFEIEGYGPGLSYHAEHLVISCPYVTDFRGSYAGLKLHAGVIIGLDAATFVGPGVCFILGVGPSFGVGVSGGVLRIRHRSDGAEMTTQSKDSEKKNLEVPEEMKNDLLSNEASQADSKTYNERAFDR